MSNTGEASLHVTVVTGGVEGDRGLNVAHETELVKSALLYADRVTIASPRLALLATVAGFLNIAVEERGDAILKMIEALPEGADARAAITELRRRKNKSRDELLRLQKMEEGLRRSGDQLEETITGMLSDAGTQELSVALAAGVLDIHPLGLAESGGTRHVAAAVADLVATVVTPGSTTLPLLDESASGLLRAMVTEGVIRDADLRPGAEPALSAAFFGRMDAYPSATMAAILEVRSELRDPLIRYRAAVAGLATSMETSIVDDRFRQDARRLYRQEVEPALLDLKETAERRGLVKLLLNNTIDVGLGKISGGAIGFAAATATDLPGLVGAGVGVAGSVLASAIEERRDLGATQRGSAYFYLYDGGERLRKE